jgi:hypothetical protein
MSRSIKFRDVLWGVATRMGMDPESGLNSNDARAVTEYINMAYRLAWKWYRWPQVCQIEQLTASGRLISWDQAGATEIDDVFGITDTDPDATDDPSGIPFTLRSTGIMLPPGYEDATVWVHFRQPPMAWSATTWVNGSTYTEGDVVFYATDGHCYTCIVATTTNAPTDTDDWFQDTFPSFLAEACKAGAYAATLAEEGQHSTAQVAGAAMEQLLNQEIELIEDHQAQPNYSRISTRVPPT